VNENLVPVSLSEQKFSLKAVLIEGQVNNVGKKVEPVVMQKEHPNFLAFDPSSAVADEFLCRLIGEKNGGVGIG
jgi:hypothetical protein